MGCMEERQVTRQLTLNLTLHPHPRPHPHARPHPHPRRPPTRSRSRSRSRSPGHAGLLPNDAWGASGGGCLQMPKGRGRLGEMRRTRPGSGARQHRRRRQAEPIVEWMPPPCVGGLLLHSSPFPPFNGSAEASLFSGECREGGSTALRARPAGSERPCLRETSVPTRVVQTGHSVFGRALFPCAAVAATCGQWRTDMDQVAVVGEPRNRKEGGARRVRVVVCVGGCCHVPSKEANVPGTCTRRG